MLKIARPPSLAEGSRFNAFPPSATRALIAVASTLVVAVVALLAGCGDPADAQGGPPHAPHRSASRPAVQRSGDRQRRVQRPPRGGRVRRVASARLRHRSTRSTSSTAPWSKRASCCSRIDPRPFDGRGRARRSRSSRPTKARIELAQERAGAGPDAARLEGRVAAGVRPAELRLAHLAGRRPRRPRRRCGSRGSISTTRTVRSPISGRASRANITAGNLVNEQTVLTSIAGVRQGLCLFRRQRADLLARCKAAPSRRRKPPIVRMGLANETGFPHDGQLDFVDNRLNPQTGAIRMRASFDNAKGQFTPGLAAKLRMEHQRQLRRRDGARAGHRHRPDEEVRLRRRRRRPAAVPRGQAGRAASTACASSPAAT